MLGCVQRREIPSTPAALLKQLNSEGYLQAQEQQQRSVRDSYQVTAIRQLCIEHLMHGTLPQLWDVAVSIPLLLWSELVAGGERAMAQGPSCPPAACPWLLACSSWLGASPLNPLC